MPTKRGTVASASANGNSGGLAEWNQPDSILSKYVRPLHIDSDDTAPSHPHAIDASPHSSLSSSAPSPSSRLTHQGVLAAGGRTAQAANQQHKQPHKHTPHTSGPYHSPLQRQLATMYPAYTESQLTLHSKFTPTFYLGPPCKSLGSGMSEAVNTNGMIQRYGVPTEQKPMADRAGYTIGAHDLTGGMVSGSARDTFSTLPPLDADQRALLQSAFDRVDDVYPLPGTAKKSHSARHMFDSPNRPSRSPHAAGDMAGVGGAEADLPPGLKRQLMPRESAGLTSATGLPQPAYDVFHLPYGFKVVRDDSVDPRTWGGADGTNKNQPSEQAVKKRVRGVLSELQQKYEEKKEPTGSPQPTAPTGTSAPPSAASSPQPPASALSARRATIKGTGVVDPSSSFHPPAPHASPSPNTHQLTPGPDIEDSAPGKQAGSQSLRDQAEMTTIDFDDEELRRSRKKKTKESKKLAQQGFGPVIGKPTKVTKIPPSRGTQLLTRFAANVRCCCLVPATGQVWSAQRDPMLVIRERMGGRVVHKLDITPSLIWCMLLVDGIMWLGTETGVIMAYSATTFKKLKQATSHSGGIHCLARGPSGIFSGSNDFTMVQWSLGALEPKQHYTGHAGGVRCILPLSAGRVWSGGDDGAIRVWDVEAATTVEEMVRHTGSVLALVTTGTHIWSASEDGTMCLWSIFPEIRCLKQVSTGSDRINTLMLVGQQVWSCGQDPRIHIWSAEDMSWLGSLKGHARYLSAFVKVRCLETRVIWSFGLGEEQILVWRNESVADDSHDKYVALLAQFSTQQDELAHLRNRVALAESAQRESEAARARDRDAFLKQLEDLLLQLAQASAGGDEQARALAEAREEIASLAAQNARLRNELRLHLEKLKANEDVIRNLLETINRKEEHITNLQSDAIEQAAKWRSRLAQLEASHAELLAARLGGDELAAALAAELATVKARNAELERRSNEGAEAASFYSAENARLHAELSALTAASQASESSSKLRADHAAQQTAALEQTVMQLKAAHEVARAEADAMRQQIATMKAQLHKSQIERDMADEATRARDARWKEEKRLADESAARSAAALHAQSRQIASLESARSALDSRLNEALTTLATVARELHSVERGVHGLTKPDHDAYTAPNPSLPRTHMQAITFQQAAARRQYHTELDVNLPPQPLFHELTRAHRSISRIMSRCLDQTNKLHVGYSPATARFNEKEEKEKMSQQEARDGQTPIGQNNTDPHADATGVGGVGGTTHTAYGAGVRDESSYDSYVDDHARPNAVDSNPEQSPVKQIWLDGE